MVRSPRFEPGSSAWQADVLDQTRLRPLIHESGWSTTPVDVKQGLAAFASFVFVFVCGVGFMVFG